MAGDGNFEELFRRALDGVVILDDDARYVDANPAACAMNGVTREQVLGMRIGAGSGAFGSEEQLLAMWRGFLQRGEMHGELRLHRPDGSVAEVEFSATASFVPHRHLAIMRDVTERKRSDRRIAAQHAVTRILAEAASLQDAAASIVAALCVCLEWPCGALWLIDQPTGRIGCLQMWRAAHLSIPGFEAMTHDLKFLPGQGLPGRVWSSGIAAWIPDLAADGNFPRASVAVAEGLHSAFALPIILAAEVLGVLEFFSPHARPPGDDVLEMLAVIGSQIGQYHERRRAEGAVREADRRKDEFLAMLAHELRNPLAPIRNAVEIVALLGTSQPQLIQATQIIERQVAHMSRLIDDLLDVSRITRGRITLQSAPVDLREVVSRALEMTSSAVIARRHELDVLMPDRPVVVQGDAVRLEQVVSNLVHNAAKYTEPGGHLEVELQIEDANARLLVRDSGIGIASDLLPSIFDLFTQADRSLERSQGGLGIGLTLVRTLVELHGGSVRASSAGIGRGSEFVVLLPRA